MKKALILVFILCLVAVTFAGCAPATPSATSGQTSSGTSSETANSEEKPSTVYTLQIGHAQPETNPRHISLLAFKEMVEERTNGGIIVEIFPAGQLGNEKEMIEAAKMGTLQGMRGGHFEYLQKCLIFTLPFLCENAKQVEALMNSDFALEISEPVKEHGLIVLGMGDAGGFRHFSNNVRPIKKPEDLVGLKMRIPGMDTVDRTFKALGATTVNVPYADLYMSLKTGVCDGQENPAVNVEGMKFYEVQKYFTMVSYQFHPDPFWVNLDWFNSLPGDYQQILYDCTKESMTINNETIAKNEAAAIAVIENNAEVYYPTPEEIEAFKKAVEPVYDQYLAEGLITQEELDTMRRIVANAK